MKKIEYLEKIDEMLSEMSWLYGQDLVCIRETDPLGFDRVDQKYDLVRQGYKWLKSIFDEEYRTYVKYVLQCSTWQRYTILMDAEELKEVVQLRELQKQLRKRINAQRPKYFKKKTHTKKRTKRTSNADRSAKSSND